MWSIRKEFLAVLPSIARNLRKRGVQTAARDELRDLVKIVAWVAAWKDLMPRTVGRLAGQPALLAAVDAPCPVPFSRLTLDAQLEVLARPVEESWAMCAPLNSFLPTWRKRAAAGQLQASPWPSSAARWLSGRAYARRFLELLPPLNAELPKQSAGKAAQAEFIRQKLRAENLYPLLWNSQP
jgi:hypothetical protein